MGRWPAHNKQDQSKTHESRGLMVSNQYMGVRNISQRRTSLLTQTFFFEDLAIDIRKCHWQVRSVVNVVKNKTKKQQLFTKNIHEISEKSDSCSENSTRYLPHIASRPFFSGQVSLITGLLFDILLFTKRVNWLRNGRVTVMPCSAIF